MDYITILKAATVFEKSAQALLPSPSGQAKVRVIKEESGEPLTDWMAESDAQIQLMSLGLSHPGVKLALQPWTPSDI